MRRLPIRPDPDLDDQRYLECRYITHQSRQVGADFHQFGIRHFQHQFIVHLQDETGLQA